MLRVLELGTRHVVPELMDDLALPEADLEHALTALTRINRVSLSAEHLWRVLEHAARTRGRLRVLDIASGAGDVPLRIATKARRCGLPLTIDGCDMNTTAVRSARLRAQRAQAHVRFFECNVLSDGVPRGYDAITCSLFLHHLSDEHAIRILGEISQAASIVVVQDLERTRFHWHLAKWTSRALSRSPVVHFDAPTSVAAAFSFDEVRALAERSGLVNAHIRRVWPWRWLLHWEQP